MAAIRERSPSEIFLEKKLLNCLPESIETTGPLFNYFKSKAKEMISYHLNKPKNPKKYSKENDSEYYDDITPPKPNFKKKPKRTSKVKEFLEIEPADDYKRLKEMIEKRAFVIENATNSLLSQKKILNSIKITTNRDHLIKQVTEVEETNENIVSELESLLLSLHECLRQAEKLSQISLFEKSNLTKELNINFQENLNKERKKYDLQIRALQDSNKSLSALPKAADVEKEYSKKLFDLQNKLELNQGTITEKTEGLRKKQSELSDLHLNLSEKTKEIGNLRSEITNLQEFIKSQEESFERENSVLKTEISKLERVLAENESAHEEALAYKVQNTEQSLQSKEREFSRLKLEYSNLEEQLRRLNFELESKQRTIFELKDEVQKLQDHKKIISRNESQEITILRQALEEKERQLSTERERISIEIETREKHRIKQKNEWAEIYTGLKHEIKELKQTIIDITEEKERKNLHSSIRENDITESQITLKAQIETLKAKLRERENELKSLWELISELQRADAAKGHIDFNDIKTLIIIKNLEEKAKQRLKKFL